MDLALNNLQRLISHKNPTNQPFNWFETITILESTQISSNSFENEITDKLFPYKSYIHLNVWEQVPSVKLLLLHSNTWTFNSVENNELGLVLKCYQRNVFKNHIDLICIYKEDSVLNNLKWLICHKTQYRNI